MTKSGPQQAAGFFPQWRLGIRYGANGSGRMTQMQNCLAFTSMNTLTLLECIEFGVVCLGNTFVSCAKVLAMSRKADLYRDNGAFIQSMGKNSGTVSPKLKQFWGVPWYYLPQGFRYVTKGWLAPPRRRWPHTVPSGGMFCVCQLSWLAPRVWWSS